MIQFFNLYFCLGLLGLSGSVRQPHLLPMLVLNNFFGMLLGVTSLKEPSAQLSYIHIPSAPYLDETFNLNGILITGIETTYCL